MPWNAGLICISSPAAKVASDHARVFKIPKEAPETMQNPNLLILFKSIAIELLYFLTFFIEGKISQTSVAVSKHVLVTIEMSLTGNTTKAKFCI